MGRRGHPPEFRRKVLDLVAAGRPIVDVARDLGISAQSIYTWQLQDPPADRAGQRDLRVPGNLAQPAASP